ncbi:TonB-dependent receptor [Phenylobacterium deserti]|uniref:TonB-dependent receptor n=1 Tax=Phenylobacterium deserti TaxID=1914756 RepID=A0A328AUW6_9CAUL|nr:TonB-dependent receptor [Phenylobacterium deserti]
MRRLSLRLSALTGAGAAALCASTAYAAPDSAPNWRTAATGTATSASSIAVDAADAADLTEVVVTARRTAERAQDVPIPLSVVSGDALERSGGYTLVDIQNRVPNLVAFNSNPRNSSVGIRGIGVSSAADGLDTSVGVYVDGVYLGRPGMALQDLIDVEQVEVLRGPQGTLFGRNSSAGVLNITTRRPSFTPGATFEVSLGDYDYRQFRGSVTGPLIADRLAGRLTVFRTDRDGVLKNPRTGVAGNSIGRFGVRGQLLFTPTESLSARLIAEYSDENDTCCVSVVNQVFDPAISATTRRTLQAFAVLGFTPAVSQDVYDANAPQKMRTDQKAVSAEVNWDLGFGDLTSISAWRYWHFDPLQDSDNTPLDILQKNAAITKDWQWSQELRLASKPGRLTWQTGLYLFRQKLKDHYVLNQFGSDAGAFYTVYNRLSNPSAPVVNIAAGSQYLGDTTAITESWAVFGQANYDLTDRLILTAGLRYTHDERHGTTVTSTRGTPYGPTSIPFNYDITVDGGNWSYLVSATWRLTDQVNAYASYSTGYKAAGLNLNSSVSAGTPLVLEPEEVQDGELGLKSSLWGNRATLNANLYWAELTGLQANIYPSNGAKSYLANVGDVRARGVELEGAVEVTSQLTLSANGSYNDVSYSDYPNGPCPVGQTAPCDMTGRPVYQAPRWTAAANAEWRGDLGNGIEPFALVQYSYRSAVFGSVDDAPYSRIKGYALLNLRAGARFGDRYEVSAWVSNALDEFYLATLGSASVPGAGSWGATGQPGAPRTAGVTLRADF